MLSVKRQPGEHVLLSDGGGRELRIRVTDVVQETGYVNLFLRFTTNHFAVTLPPGATLPIGPTAEFNADIEIRNRTASPVTQPRVHLSLDLPPQVRFNRNDVREVVQ